MTRMSLSIFLANDLIKFKSLPELVNIVLKVLLRSPQFLHVSILNKNGAIFT